MRYFLLLTALLGTLAACAQNKGPVEITPQLRKQLAAAVEKETASFKQHLKSGDLTDAEISFATDTFRVERLYAKSMELDYTTAGMRSATNYAAGQYDGLLNSWYSKLAGVLKGNDRLALVQAQRAWISFRDRERKLIETVSLDKYSGGGTIQQLTNASAYLELIKQRTLTVFEHYRRAAQGN